MLNKSTTKLTLFSSRPRRAKKKRARFIVKKNKLDRNLSGFR
jgi:hypothetical protein